MTNHTGRERRRVRLRLVPALTAAAVAVVAVVAAIAGASSAQAQEWLTPYDSNKTKFAERSARGTSSAPEVAPRKRRSHHVAVDASDDDSAPRARRTRTARLKTNSDDDSGGYAARPKVGGGHVSWVASGGCLPGELRSVISGVSQYGQVVVSSTGRGHSHNAAVGGAKGSYHLSCQAADFRVHGNVASAASYLRNHGSVGGFHHYGGGLFHIDTGPKRTW